MWTTHTHAPCTTVSCMNTVVLIAVIHIKVHPVVIGTTVSMYNTIVPFTMFEINVIYIYI